MLKPCPKCRSKIQITFFKRYLDNPIQCPSCSTKCTYGIHSRAFTLYILILSTLLYFILKLQNVAYLSSLSKTKLLIMLVVSTFIFFYYFFGNLSLHNEPIDPIELDDLKDHRNEGHGSSVWGSLQSFTNPEHFYKAKLLVIGFIPYRIKCFYKVKSENGQLRIIEKFPFDEIHKTFSKSEIKAIKRNVFLSYLKDSRNIWGYSKTLLSIILLVVVIVLGMLGELSYE